jgi:hypothetical protein
VRIVYANEVRCVARRLEIGLVCSSSRGAVYAFGFYAFAAYAFAAYAFAAYTFAVYAFAFYAFAALVPAPGNGIDGPRMMDSHAAAS